MFTVEDVNSVLLTDKVNDFHSVNTSLRGGLEYVLLDFVKVRRTVNGFSFTVDNSLWSGGFYLTDMSGEYISLSSGDYSYSDGVLSVVTDETDVVLVLYCSSFYTVFSLQYLDCRLDSLMSVVNEINLTVDDFTSLNGTAITESDISVSDGVVTCRGNTFYKGIMVTPTPIIFYILGSTLYPGAPKAPLTITGVAPNIGGITVEFDNRKETIQPTETTSLHTNYTIEDVDFTKYNAGDTFTVKVTYEGITYTLTKEVPSFAVYNANDLEKALEFGIHDLNCRITLSRDVHVNNPSTFTGRITFTGGNLIIDDNTNVTFKDFQLNGDLNGGLLLLGENTQTKFTNCTLNYLYEGGIRANEDVNNIDSSLIFENCTFRSVGVPFIMYDGDLRITDCQFDIPLYANSNKLEPSFIHMTGGRLTVINTEFIIRKLTQSAISVEGYNLASLLLSEDTTFNGVNATELSKGNPSLTQYGITSQLNVNYQNGDETVHLTDGFYVAVEDKKIKNIKED